MSTRMMSKVTTFGVVVGATEIMFKEEVLNTKTDSFDAVKVP